MPQFSIILPVRNGSNYIRECISSILSQTYTSFELLILENASTDNTVEIINSFGDERIKIIPAERPLTIEENWARAVEIPKAEYMTLIGHDDILQPNFLEIINGLIKTHPDATLYHTHFSFIDSKGKVIRACKPMPQKLELYQLLEGFLKNTIDSMGTGYVMRSVDYNTIGGIPVKYPGLLFADFDLWLQLTALSYETISAENCFSFRLHQSITSTSADTRLHNALEIYTDSLNDLKTKDKRVAAVINKHGAQLFMRFAVSYSHRILRTPKNKRGNVSVKNFVNFVKQLAEKLGVENFQPEKDKNIMLAKMIDSSRLLSSLFLFMKKLYGKPFRN